MFVLGICTTHLIAQDMFLAKRLTFSPAQQGFPTWSPDGNSIIFQRTDMQDRAGENGLWRMSADGQDAKQFFNELAEHPRMSPDGLQIVFDADTGYSIKIVPSEGGTPFTFLPDTIHIENGGLPCWSPDGTQIAFVERTGLSVCVYNLESGALTSIFQREGLLPLPGGWSNDGKSILIALMDRKTRKSTIWKVSSDGEKQIQIKGHRENFYRYLALSPEGSLLVYGAIEGRYVGLYVMPSGGGASLPLAVSPNGHNEGAVWSPDGTKIAFTSTRSGSFDIWVMDVDIKKIQDDLLAISEFPE